MHMCAAQSACLLALCDTNSAKKGLCAFCSYSLLLPSSKANFLSHSKIGQICIGLEIISFVQKLWCLLLISVMYACGQLAVHVHAATLTPGKQ